jgi:hypothetical protein
MKYHFQAGLTMISTGRRVTAAQQLAFAARAG